MPPPHPLRIREAARGLGVSATRAVGRVYARETHDPVFSNT